MGNCPNDQLSWWARGGARVFAGGGGGLSRYCCASPGKRSLSAVPLYDNGGGGAPTHFLYDFKIVSPKLIIIGYGYYHGGHD